MERLLISPATAAVALLFAYAVLMYFNHRIPSGLEALRDGFQVRDRAWLGLAVGTCIVLFGAWIAYLVGPEATALQALYRGAPAVEMVEACRHSPDRDLAACLRREGARHHRANEAERLLELLRRR